MSLTGSIIKNSGKIRSAVSRIATSSLTGVDGMPIGTKKIIGYVCEINVEGELAGTVNVQEFNVGNEDYDKVEGIGLHEGVLLSAIQNNSSGYLIVPMLFSEVMIIQNPLDGHEYVIMYSQVQCIQLTSHSLEGDNDGIVKIGVTEVERFVEDEEDGLEKDYDELEPSGNQTSTIYTAKSIKDQVVSSEDTEGFVEEKTVDTKTIKVGDTKITINGSEISIDTKDKITLKIGDTTITQQGTEVNIESQNCTIKGSNVKVDGSQVTITGGTLTAKGQSNTDLMGPFNAIKACPFSGAPHCGSQVVGT